MTTTILLVGHGSRNQAGNDEIQDFRQQWQALHPDWRIELCYIELAEVLLDEGLRRAAQGAGKVIVVPLILNAAGHVKTEIPEHIAEARERFPEVEFIYAPHIGANEDILRILEKNLKIPDARPGDAGSQNHRRHHSGARLLGPGRQRRTGENGALALRNHRT